MKRLAVIALGAALFVGVAVAGSGRRGMLERPLVLRGAVSTSPLLGLEYRSTQAWLERLDRRTLKRLSGRRLGLAEFSGGWSYSPDRSLLASGNQSSTALTYLPARIRLINAYTLRKVRDVPLGLTGEVMYTYWVAPARLLALVQSREDSGTEGERPIATDRVIVVDPTTGAVRATEKLEGTVAALAKADHALALVLEGKSYGPVRLVVADDNSRLDYVTLDGVRAGLHQTPAGVPRVDGVAVAVDRQRGRAYVVAAGEPVAEAALATLTVEYHVPSEPVSLLGRLHNWLEPPAHAKGSLEGSWRSAVWLGGGLRARQLHVLDR